MKITNNLGKEVHNNIKDQTTAIWLEQNMQIAKRNLQTVNVNEGGQNPLVAAALINSAWSPLEMKQGERICFYWKNNSYLGWRMIM